MEEITDEYMLEMRAKTKQYTMMILKDGPNSSVEDRDKIVWEHGRRNHSLRRDGVLSIVCPVLDESEIRGFGILYVDSEETRRIMDQDPGVEAGVFVYEVHPVRSFPGDSLP